MIEWNEWKIAKAISQQTLARKCVVLVDNCSWTGHECDVLAVTQDLRIIDIEVKISRKDFKADAKKDKWWRRDESRWWHLDGPPCPKLSLPHPRRVWKHYFAMPAEIWTPDLTQYLPSECSGVLLLRERPFFDGAIEVYCERRAKPAKDAYKLSPIEVMDIARMANLRMWEALGKARD